MQLYFRYDYYFDILWLLSTFLITSSLITYDYVWLNTFCNLLHLCIQIIFCDKCLQSIPQIVWKMPSNFCLFAIPVANKYSLLVKNNEIKLHWFFHFFRSSCCSHSGLAWDPSRIVSNVMASGFQAELLQFICMIQIVDISLKCSNGTHICYIPVVTSVSIFIHFEEKCDIGSKYFDTDT